MVLENVALKLKKWLSSIKPTSKNLKRYGFLAIFVGLFSASLPFLDYTHQSTVLSDPDEIVLLSIFFIVIGLLILATYSLWLKTNGERLFASIVITYLFTERWGDIVKSFEWFRSSLGPEFATVIIQISLYALIGLLAIGLRKSEQWVEKRKWSKDPLQTMVKFACVIVFLSNTYALSSYLYERRHANSYKPDLKAISTRNEKSRDAKRDIYYFVFDRYTNADVLKSHFNFDNKEYLDWLKNEGFTIRDNSYSNYPFTAPSLASTLRMDYHTDVSKLLKGDQPDNFLPYKTLIENSEVSNFLHKQGYEVYNIGNWWNLTRKQKNSINILPQFEATVVNQEFILSEIQSQGINKSFLGGLLKKGISLANWKLLKVNHDDPRQVYLTQLEQIKRLANEPHDKPRFIFAHFLNAHPPYVFNKDGSLPSYNGDDSDVGLPRKEKYINQLQATNTSTKELIKTIKRNSKISPIFVVQSDEGPYPVNATLGWKNESADELKLKFGILAAYNLPGVKAEEAQQISSSVNAFRFIFNNYFDTNHSILPDCSYIFTIGNKPFTYRDVTPKLHQSSPACAKYK